MAIQDGSFHAPSAGAALAGALTIQIGTNFCNDYFDFFQGADTEARKGPVRAVQAGLIAPGAMLAATIFMFTLTVLISFYLFTRAGWLILIIGALSVLCGVLYTAGRYSLAYLGLGDPFVLLFLGRSPWPEPTTCRRGHCLGMQCWLALRQGYSPSDCWWSTTYETSTKTELPTNERWLSVSARLSVAFNIHCAFCWPLRYRSCFGYAVPRQASCWRASSSCLVFLSAERSGSTLVYSCVLVWA